MDTIPEYLKKVGVAPVQDLEEAIFKTFGYTQGQPIVDTMDALFTRQEERLLHDTGHDATIAQTIEMSNFLATSEPLTLLCASFYDHIVFKRFMKLLSAHLDVFGHSVLDLGCGNGILTGFVASSLPSHEVTGTDLSQGMLQRAEAIRKRLGIPNLQYLPRNGLEGRVFDTVLSIRTFHENMPYPAPGDTRDSDPERSRAFASQGFRTYAQEVFQRIKPHGTLVSIERVVSKSLWQGMQDALCAEGFQSVFQEPNEIRCLVGDETGVFRFVIYEKTAEEA